MQAENLQVENLQSTNIQTLNGQGLEKGACPYLKIYSQEHFSGERALYAEKNAKIAFSTFSDGESPLKHAENVQLEQVIFTWKYPLWHSKNIELLNSHLLETARAGIWYTQGINIKNTLIAAPKSLRRCQDVFLQNVDMVQAEETLWNCENVNLENVSAKGPYFGMNSRNITINNLRLTGDYAFDGAKNIVVENSHFLSRDLFWNCENVTVRNSFISGEYLGWNSKNLHFENCVISSLQGLCYIDGLVMENCRFIDTVLAFEYSHVEVKAKGHIDSVFNPAGGKITADSIGSVTLDPERIDPKASEIKVCEHK